MKHKFTFFDFIVYLVMFFVLIACLVPFLYILSLSISSASAVVNNEVFLWPKDITFDAYSKIFAYPYFFRAYANTIFYTFAGTLISLILMVLFAYPLSKKYLTGSSLAMKLVIFSMFFSGGLIPNYLLISSLNLVNTPFAILLPFAINQFNLILLVSFFKSMPNELEEAAEIDGLGYFQTLLKIIIPLSTAGIATIALYTAVFFWNDWFNGLIYLKSSQFPVMLFLRNIVNGTTMIGNSGSSVDSNSIEITIKSAVIIISTLPIIILYPFLQKYFVKGIMVGSVKG